MLYKWFGKSTNPQNVIVGKQGHLFLGNMHNKLVYKTLDVYPYSALQIKNWSKNLLDLQQWFENKGMGFVLVLAPNKHSIYAEKLPQWVKPAEINITDKLVSASKNINAHIIDLRETLLQEKSKQSELLYWKTDSHWNELGASIGFQATLDGFNSYHRKNIISPKYKFVTKTTKFIGGHARFLKIQHLLPNDFETFLYRVIDNENEVCVGKIDINTFKELPCKMKLRPYLDIHQGPVYTVNDTALNPESVLLLSDSFLMQNSTLFDQTFSKTWKHKYNHLKGEDLQRFIDIHQPDLVIYQVVERSLFNNHFININDSSAP